MKKMVLILVLVLIFTTSSAFAFGNPTLAINNDVIIKNDINPETGDAVITKAVIPTADGFYVVLFPFIERDIYVIIQHNFLCNITDITYYNFP